jgi:sporulation protein YlmC with PRC-barrel domain
MKTKAETQVNAGARDKEKVYIKETSRKNNLEDSIALKEGARVISNDEQLIGTIERVITIAPEKERVTDLVVSQGLIWIEKKQVPVHWISNVTEDVVTLSVSSESIENLPEYQPQT